MSCQSLLVKHKDTDDRLLVTGCRVVDVTTGVEVYLNAGAVLQATLMDRATQTALTGETWPVTLTYIVGSNGNFHAPLRDTVVVVEYQQLDLRLTIDNGADQRRTMILPCIAHVDRGVA